MKIHYLCQNIRELNENIQKEGCYFIDLLNIYQDVTEHNLGYKTVNAVYVMSNRVKNFNGKPYLSKSCFVNDIQGISQIVSGLTGIPVVMKGVNSYEEFTHLIGIFERTTQRGAIVRHYGYLNLDKTVRKDPWCPKSKTIKVGKLVDFRYILARRL